MRDGGSTGSAGSGHTRGDARRPLKEASGHQGPATTITDKSPRLWSSRRSGG
jgi:hypothetical protein